MHRDPIELEIFKNIYHSIAEEMGAALRRTAFSPNIKERRDYSCAIFDSQGEVIAMGDHMPVHLGSMPMSVQAAIESRELSPGDVVMLNDPFRGGTHLPDITLVAPVYMDSRQRGRTPGPPGTEKDHDGKNHGGVGGVRIFMWLRERITRMWAGLIPDRWGCAAKFIRKVCEFLRFGSCARGELSATFCPCC